MSTSGGENQQKKLKTEEEAIGDRISSLSDGLLHKILSFMHTKYAVQTCVLSKRWQFLWKSLPYLDFDHRTFPYEGILTFPFKGNGYEAEMFSLYNFISTIEMLSLQFKKFRQAKSITLPWGIVQALSRFPSMVDENRLPFSNLKCLKIKLGERKRCDKDIPDCVLNFFLNSFTTLKLSV